MVPRPVSGAGATGKRSGFAHLVEPRALVAQSVLLAAVALGGVWLATNAAHNMAARGLASGFAFLSRPAGFDISEHLIPFGPEDTNARVFLVGALNTLFVAAIGIVGATVLGFLGGVARLSGNLLVRSVATSYVETARNIPAAIQILLWYSLIYLAPPPRDAQPIAGFVLSNRGLRMPSVVWHGAVAPALLLAAVLLVGGMLAARALARRRTEAAKGASPAWGWSVGLGLALLAVILVGRPVGFDIPHRRDFEFEGGMGLSPVLVALATGLAVYTGAFIAEIVRGGLQAVAAGQAEAARSLGLPPGVTLRRVVLPQALRAIVPPLANQYLNLTKNSSLAVIIGYPDLVAVFAGTTLNQTGQAIETISLTMAFYIVASLCISLLMNGWNRHLGRWAAPA